MARFLPTYAAIACLVLLLCHATHLLAADTVNIEVTGVEGEALKNVRDVLTLPYGLLRNGEVDRPWLDRFAHEAAEKSRAALEPYGYYHAQATGTVVEPQKGSYRLLITVIPGEPLRLSQVDVELKGAGAGEAELRRLTESFPLVKGGVLLQPRYEQAKNSLKASAVALGFLDATFSRHEIIITKGATAASIGLTLETGERYYFGAVRLEGAPDYPQQYLERFVAFRKGDVFSHKKLAETQLNLSNSERFKEVIITPEKQQAQDARIPVRVQLISAPRRSLRPGVGYGTDTGGRFTARYRDLNLFQAGHDLDLNLYLAERLQGVMGRYTLPSPLDLKNTKSVQVNLQKAITTTYVSRLAALELAHNHSFGSGELGTAYVKVQQEFFTIGGQDSRSRLVLPGIRYTQEQFDNLVRPNLGYRYSLDLRGAHPYLGSDSGLVQFIAEGNALLPLPGRLSLHLRNKVGASLLADPLADLPPSIRFFAGGDQSVRGYAYQSLGPRDAKGRVVGGRDLLVGSIELERALFTNWGVSAFHDAGSAFNSFNNIQLSQGAGLGVHYYTPVGGLNLSLAKRLDTSRDVYTIHFTVGLQL